jgi:hypothetical protein
MGHDCLTRFVICGGLQLVIAISAAEAQTHLRFSVQTSYPEMMESFRCNENAPLRRFELLSLPPQGAPLPIQDPACIGQFSIRAKPQQAEEWTDWQKGQPPRISCIADSILAEVPSPRGGKSKFCGIMCEHGRPVKFCTY